ncbi:MAG TPA: hypothetical protein VHW24_12610 [Bryobacteraceae bacterium]|jgi:hypothetical protein|nr:hypothetical protein [Bryobacteraceae bacterium]
MSRALYSSLIYLHPRSFRRQFGEEMLWIFDESAAASPWRTQPALFGDALLSILRQWIIGCGTWKIAAAFLGGILHLWLVFGLLMMRPPVFHLGAEVIEEPAIFHHEEAPPCLSCEASRNATTESPR